jgi:hypothetical protein
MIKRPTFVALASLSLWGSVGAAEVAVIQNEAVYRAAWRAASEYSGRLQHGNLDYLVERAPIQIAEEMRKRGASLRDAIKSMLEVYLGDSNRLVSEAVGWPMVFQVNETYVAVVPTQRHFSATAASQVPYKYILFSFDSGLTWSVYDNSCYHEEVVKRLAVGWHGTPALDVPYEKVRMDTQ